MSQRDIRSLFGKKAGGGDDEKTESARVLKQNEKRKTQQKEYDKKPESVMSRKHGWKNFHGRRKMMN